MNQPDTMVIPLFLSATLLYIINNETNCRSESVYYSISLEKRFFNHIIYNSPDRQPPSSCFVDATVSTPPLRRNVNGTLSLVRWSFASVVALSFLAVAQIEILLALLPFCAGTYAYRLSGRILGGTRCTRTAAASSGMIYYVRSDHRPA